MKVLISEIPEDGLDFEIEEVIESDIICSPINAQVNVVKIGTEVIIKGKITAEVRLQCSRCLNEFSKFLTVPIDVVYHPVDELKGEEKHEILLEELDMDFYSGEEMDINELIKEQIILNIPMKPLCNEFCKGICIRCGSNLNYGKCSCEIERDNRFKILKKLLNNSP